MPRATRAPHLRKRSITLAGHRTSIALEPAFWAVLDALAAQDGTSFAAFVARIDAERGSVPLASVLRVHALTRAGGVDPTGPDQPAAIP